MRIEKIMWFKLNNENQIVQSKINWNYEFILKMQKCVWWDLGVYVFRISSLYRLCFVQVWNTNKYTDAYTRKYKEPSNVHIPEIWFNYY